MGANPKGTRRKYTPEFKREALRLVTEQGLTFAQAARDLGIGESVLNRWKHESAAAGEDAFPGNGNLKGDEKDVRIAKLLKENETLRMEREVLKKAINIFSQGPKA